jgi:proliferating cell nuclear antigen
MKLVLSDLRLFKESINVLSELVSEACFNVKKDYIEVVAMDPANISMIVLKFLGNNFEEYSIEKEEKINVNLTYLKQILKRAYTDDKVTFLLNNNKLKIELLSKAKRAFEIPLLDSGEEERRVPELAFDVNIQMPSSELNDIIEDASIISDAITFIIDNSKLIVESKGDLSSMKIEYPSDKITLKTNEQKKYKAKYALDYLKKMIKSSKISDTVHMKFNTEYPLKLEFILIDKVELSFILAPRMEND